jgi:hypothetical protein
VVLIEGPADATHLIAQLAAPGMRPPIALLAYPKGDPANAAFWPFAEFSPEYQAALWALRHDAAAEFIDLPAAAGRGDDAAEDGDARRGERLRRDPLGELAAAAGYLDAESWWCDLLEQNPSPGPVFGAVAEAMAELRRLEPTEPWEAKREAHMRLKIAQAAKGAAGPVAVVCGAWHVPALTGPTRATEDRRLLVGLPRAKIQATWAPWSLARLASGTGYGAGVDAPGWNQHIWRTWGRADSNSRWLARIGALLRTRGHGVSTADLIEAERLALALAALRGRPRSGFEELRDAAVACLFGGEDLVWRSIEAELLLGRDVGAAPEDGPAAPLIADVQRAQRATRLKPEALERSLTLDLRSDAGRERSLLLHRLCALGVPWGQPQSVGGSRGTFRENWKLRWDPEFSVVLVERVIYGSELVGAADAYLEEAMRGAQDLATLAHLVSRSVTASLPEAWAVGLRLLEGRAALTSDVGQLLGSVAPIAEIARYGQARQADMTPLAALAERLAVQAALGLRHAARGLDDSAAAALVDRLRSAQAGLELLDPAEETWGVWFEALAGVLAGGEAFAAGAAGQLLYTADRLTPEAAVGLLARRLSPGTPAAVAARFVEGFFSTQAARLIYDAPLREAVDRWIRGLEDADFLAYLPLLRRVFADLDAMERKRLRQAALGEVVKSLPGVVTLPDAVWAAHFDVLAPILARGRHV